MAALLVPLSMAQPLTYPETRKTDQADVYHGTPIFDPYRWLEDDNSLETAAWVRAQNQLTNGWLAQIPQRETIKARLQALWNYPRYGMPFQEGGKYFYTLNTGLQNQAVWYMQDNLRSGSKVVLDPNALSPDGTVAVNGFYPSKNAAWVAYSQSQSGSDWQKIRIRNAKTGQDLPETLEWIKFSGVSWDHAHKGFYYSRYPQPKEGSELQAVNLNQEVWYHAVGTPQSADRLIFGMPDFPERGFGAYVTDDGRYLIINVWEGTDSRNRLYYKDLKREQSPVVKLVDTLEATYSFVGNIGSVFYIQSNLDAPKGKIVTVDIRQPDRKNWRTLIPETDYVIENTAIIARQLIVQYLADVKSKLSRFSLAGRLLGDIELPGPGSVSGISGRSDGLEMFFSFTNAVYPNTIFRFDFTTYRTTVFKAPQVDFKPADYETKQVFYTSKDGTKIPMTITHKKGIPLNGLNPTLLYGYGGFGINLTPWFSISYLVWMEMGGVVAVANLRGGAEYGEAWHQAGMLEKKQNVFDDFIAAGEYLIAQKYTSPKRLVINGGSNGGLLVGAVLNQRPDLFGAAIPEVGVMDMLRYHKFTIGWAWATEYGASDDARWFKVLQAYSPLHNIRTGISYPPTLILTADHDDRVVPAHSFKYGAALQAAQTGTNPILIRIETKAGHGGGRPISKVIEAEADKWAFLVRVLGM